MNKLLLVLLLIAGPAWAQDTMGRGDYISQHMMTGGFTSGQFTNTEFQPAPRIKPLVTRPQTNLARDMDAVVDYDSYTLGMVLIDQGRVVYQRYAQGTDATTEFHSWSMAKSITNILVGQAICRGDIRMTDRAYQYRPDIKNTVYGQATIYELLTMTTGATGQDPKTGSTQGSNYQLSRGFKSQRDYIIQDGDKVGPRGVWHYDGLHQDTLGLVLDAARGRKYYMQQFLNSAGVESKSHWFTDKDGHINAAYGLGLTLSDWARVAQFSLDILNRQADIADKDCMSDFMRRATESIVTVEDMRAQGYESKYGWGYTWANPMIKNGYAWQGAFGQKVWVDPTTQRIVIQFRNLRNKEHTRHMLDYVKQWRLGYYD